MNKPKNPKTQSPHSSPSSGIKAQAQAQSNPQPYSGNLADRYRFGPDKADVSSEDDVTPVRDLGPDCEEIQDHENDVEQVYIRTYPHPVDSMTDDEYKEYVRRKVQEGIESADRGELISHEEVVRQMRKWIKEAKKDSLEAALKDTNVP